MKHLIALLFLALACSDAAEPATAATPDPVPAETAPATIVCDAEPGIWTVEVVLSAPGPDECGYAGRTSKALDDGPLEAALSVKACNISRTETEDGCSVLCRKTSATPGMELEMLLSYESPTRISGYTVLAGNGLRCEYDVTYTRI